MPAMPERDRHGERYQGRYYGHGGNLQGHALDLEAQEQDYAHQPYQHLLQDMPLLSGNVSQEHEHLYDSSGDHTPFLQYRGPREPSWSNLNTPSLSEGAKEAQPVETRESIPLFRGNLVFGCPVPPKLLGLAPGTQPPHRDESTHMRYTAATCDPADFFKQRFTFRQQLFEQPRSTDLLIIVTMYNEDDILFARTMAGVFENIQFMCNGKGKHGGSLGKDG
jgi:chitin synthase